jgi:hypothetical protein
MESGLGEKYLTAQAGYEKRNHWEQVHAYRVRFGRSGNQSAFFNFWNRPGEDRVHQVDLEEDWADRAPGW